MDAGARVGIGDGNLRQTVGAQFGSAPPPAFAYPSTGSSRDLEWVKKEEELVKEIGVVLERL